MEFYNLEKEEVLHELNSPESGLNSKEAEIRLKEYGFNKIKEKKKAEASRIFLRQVNSFVVYILLAAILISIIVNEFLDATVIAAIVVLNTILGFVQEYNAENAILALKKIETSKTLVRRDGKELLIASSELVPGDVILVEAGQKVPADFYLLETFNLKVDESILTGESVPVEKISGELKGKKQVSEQSNIIFNATNIVYGRCKAIVVKTGMQTELGKIAKAIQEVKEKPTPLQKKLTNLGVKLGISVIIVAIVIFLVGLSRGQEIYSILLIAISLAVAAVPEGLPIVVTISLALGVKRMVKKHVLVRKLSSVETLGSTTIISADKTGTITKNEMNVTKLFVDSNVINLEENSKNKALLLNIAANCNNAVLPDIGDPTELALLRAADKYEKLDRIDEVPFSSENKFMITVHDVEGKKISYVKGAPETILDLCSKINVIGRISKLTPLVKKKILKQNEKFAENALRVLGCAYKEGNAGKDGEEMIFVGLIGMIDLPREKVRDAVKKCKKAGIKVVMITGDHKLTAHAIARQIGLGQRTLTGNELDELNDKELRNKALFTDIYARVNPAHKVRILEAFKPYNIMAMTGDGINDAPALKDADIGIAVGKGSDVAKEASDMVLLDNNFSSIVNAVEEGRGIYNNIKKFVNYLLSSNLGEVLVIFIAMLIGFKVGGKIVLPLMALQILWINLITDGLPALALGVDPVNLNVMNKKPRSVKEHIISKNMGLNIIVIGILIAIAALTLFKLTLPDIIKAQTIVFTALVVMEIVRVYMVRSQYKIGIFSNKWLILAILTSILLQLMVVYVPFFNNIFNTTALLLIDWVLIIMAAIFVLLFGLIFNGIIRRFTKEED